MTAYPAFVGGAATPWVGDRILTTRTEVVSFDGQDHSISMKAEANTLTWSIPDATAHARGTKASFNSSVERLAVTRSIEAWLFPKLDQEPVHHVVLLLDRDQGTTISIELILRATNNRLRPDIRILRGTLDGYPYAYGGFAFPRLRHGARRISFSDGGKTSYIDFDRTGQPSTAGRGDSHWRVSGHALSIAPTIWGVVWRDPTGVALALFDEAEGTVNGQLLDVESHTATTFGVRSDLTKIIEAHSSSSMPP